MNRTFNQGFLIALISLCSIFSVLAQNTGETKEMRTLKLRLQEATLKLQRAEANLTKAETQKREAGSLFEKGLTDKTEVSKAEDTYNEARLQRDQATIDLEKTRLDFLNDALSVRLDKASIYRDLDGYKHVSLILTNASNINKVIDDEKSTLIADGNKKALLRIENLKVSIRLNNNLIGKPFEQMIQALAYGESRTIDFILQKETDLVTVCLNYATRDFTFPVYLEKEAREDRINIEANQFSQEGELGNKVTYDLALERLVEDDKNFSLDAVNLPKEYVAEFMENNVRVSRIRFKKESATKNIKLVVNIPSELPKDVIDKKFIFQVVILDNISIRTLNDLKQASGGQALPIEKLDASRISNASLELIPRGRAELTISAQNLFYKIKIGEVIKFNFSLTNTGTVNLDRVRVKLTSLPMGWSANIKPEKEIPVDVFAEKRIDVQIFPATDVVVGDYEAKIEAFTQHEGRDVKAEPKALRMQVEAKSNFLLGLLLMLVLVGLVAGVAVVTIKISRR